MIKRRNCYNDLAIENILDANVKLIDRNKDLEKENKELKEKFDKVKEYIKTHSNNLMFELRIEEMKELLSIINGEEYEENKDIFSFI